MTVTQWAAGGLYARAGEAHAAGAPIGAAVDVARATRTPGQAGVAGSAFGVAARPTPAPLPQHESPEWANRTESWIEGKAGQATRGLFNLFYWMNKPLEKVADLAETQLRYRDYQWSGRGDAMGFIQASFGVPAWWDGKWREAWDQTQESQASIAQTAWLSESNAVRNLMGHEAGFGLLDDPSREEERREYFNSGVVRWTTGLTDAAFSVAMDPLIWAGAAGGVGKAAIKRISPGDVVHAAESHRAADAAAGLATDAVSLGKPVGNLTRGARRLQSTVDNVVAASERVREGGVPGGYADLAGKGLFAQTADAGAIPYFMSRLDNYVDDATRISMKREALYAGMGDKAALARLSEWDDRIALELRNLTGPNPESAIQSILSRMDLPHADKLRMLNEGDELPRLVNAYKKQLAELHEGLYRTRAVGNPADLTPEALAKGAPGLGEISTLKLFDGTKVSREYARVGRTIHHFPGLPPIHVLFGRHLPGMFSLSADDAYQSFGSALMQARPRTTRGFGSVDDVTAKELADEFAMSWSAANPAAARATRRDIVDRFNRTATDNLAAKYGKGDGVREQQIKDFINQIRSNRSDEMMVLHERAQRAAQAGDEFTAHRIENGVVVWKTTGMKDELATPFSGTQLADLVSIPDYLRVEKAIRAKFSEGTLGYMRRSTDGAWRLTEEGLSQFSDLWKFSALLRLGYPIRTQVDSQARLVATLGAYRYMDNMLQGSKNLVYNSKRVTAGEVDDAIFRAQVSARIREIDAAGGSAVERSQLVDMLDNYKPRATVARGRKVRRGNTALAKRIGMGEGVDDAYRSVNEFDRALGGVSARESITGLMVSAHNSALHKLRASGQWQHIVGTHPKWNQSYLEFTNKRVRNSHGLRMILAGESDEVIVDWLKANPDGMAQFKSIASRYTDRVAAPVGADATLGGARAVTHELGPEQLVQVMRNQMDLLYPTQQVRSLVLADDLNEAMLGTAFKTEAVRPAIPADLMTPEKVNLVAEGYNTFRSFWFKWAAEIPEERLARHPFYQARFTDHVRRIAPRTADGDFAPMTLAQVNQLRKRAGVLAQRDVGRYMFDTANRSNMAHLARFVSPFYAAWSDTMRKWARIIGEHPGFAPVIPKAFMAPNNMVVVVDNDGNRILRDGSVVDGSGKVLRKSVDFTEGHLLVGVPEWLTGWTGGSDKLRVSKTSLNVVFQGDPWFLPGPGPLLAVPANHLATQVWPEAFGEDTYTKYAMNYLLPFGSSDDGSVEQALPMWMRNLKTAIRQDFDDDRFAQTYTQLMADELIAIRKGEREPVSDVQLQREVANKARNWFLLRVIGSQAPFSTSPTSRIQFWRDEWRRYRRELGGEARERFYEDYPDYFEATISLSINEGGISATDDAWNAMEAYKSEIRNQPKYGWLWAGAANMAPGFDAHIYTAQKAQGFRGTKNPDEALQSARESAGWLQYRPVAGALQLKLEERAAAGGSANINAKSNEDLKLIKDQFLTELMAENPQWAAAYEQGGTGEALNEFFRVAAEAVRDRPELGERSDFVSLDQYLTVRDAIRAKLTERKLSSVDSEGAGDLQEIWLAFVSELVASDIGFEQMYQRAQLDKDIIATTPEDRVEIAMARG